MKKPALNMINIVSEPSLSFKEEIRPGLLSPVYDWWPASLAERDRIGSVKGDTKGLSIRVPQR